MQSTGVPARLPIPFANAGGKNAIPTAASQTPGGASLTEGFPPLTRTPLAGGGIPPSGLDMNGVLYLVSAWSAWASAGGQTTYDQAFANAVGGHPAGAVLASRTMPGVLWVCTQDSNASDPDNNGGGWLRLGPGLSRTQAFQASGSFTVPAGVTRARVRVWGGGGGGGGSQGAGSGGSAGSGGGYIEGMVGLTPGASVPVTVGAGGAGGAITGGSPYGNGGSGGTSSFGSLLSATGGGQGYGANGAFQSNGSTGGTGAGTGFKVPGTSGGTPYTAGGGVVVAIGGGTFGTSNAGPNQLGAAGTVNAGVYPGGGGNGGALGGSGGAGAPGVVVIEY